MHTYTVHIFEIIPNKLYCAILYIKVYIKMLVRNRKKSRSIILKLDLTMARNKRFYVRIFLAFLKIIHIFTEQIASVTRCILFCRTISCHDFSTKPAKYNLSSQFLIVSLTRWCRNRGSGNCKISPNHDCIMQFFLRTVALVRDNILQSRPRARKNRYGRETEKEGEKTCARSWRLSNVKCRGACKKI